MPNPTLREIVETFTEEELALTVPIEFQDVSLEDYPYVNEYNRLLASAQANLDDEAGYNAFQAAYEYRVANKDKIDKYIIDAKKLNILMTLVINAYMFSKGEKSAINTSYDNAESGIEAENIQDAVDTLNEKIEETTDTLTTTIEDIINYMTNQLNNFASRHVYVTELPSNPDPNVFYYLPEK